MYKIYTCIKARQKIFSEQFDLGGFVRYSLRHLGHNIAFDVFTCGIKMRVVKRTNPIVALLEAASMSQNDTFIFEALYITFEIFARCEI